MPRRRFRTLKGVLSLWTRTPMFCIERGPLLVQTLAVCLASRVFTETEFVTDRLGAQIAECLGWKFDRVVTPLENLPCAGLTHIWALGKLAACSIQEKPFVQFDGDVLLFKPLPERLTRSRLIAQSEDFPHFYTSNEMRRAFDLAGFPVGANAYNGGLLGGSDVALVRAYAWAGLEAAAKLRDHAFSGTLASMAVEQYQLGVFAERTGVPVGTLLPLHPTHDEVTAVGYAHLQGGAKRDTHWVARAEALLAREFPAHHARFLDRWPSLAALTARVGHEFSSSYSGSAPLGGELLHHLQGPGAPHRTNAAVDTRSAAAGR